jgi:adenylate cyclase
MKIFFNKRFDEEALSSEKLRTTILVWMLAFAVLYLTINIAIGKATGTAKPEIGSMLLLLVFHCALLVFEILAWLRINFRIKKQQYSIHNFERYLNSFLEICSPGLIIVILAKQYVSPMLILHAPVAYLYFIFIILSTLRARF